MTHLQLETMTVEEKLQAMESIWDDLCSRAETVPSPPWHREVLAERDAALQRGTETVEDWEAAKRKMAKDLQ